MIISAAIQAKLDVIKDKAIALPEDKSCEYLMSVIESAETADTDLYEAMVDLVANHIVVGGEWVLDTYIPV